MSGGQRLAGLLVFLSDIHSLGLKTTQGLTITSAWYWDKDDASRAAIISPGPRPRGKRLGRGKRSRTY